MANNNTKAKSPIKSTTAKLPAVESTNIEKTETLSAKSVKLGDDVLIKCKSTCPHLLFKSKDNSEIFWENTGDVQELSMRELREMKATQQAFFTSQWLVVLGVADNEDVKASTEDIYKALGVIRHYEHVVDVSKFYEIAKWNAVTIKEKVAMMSTGAQENLIVALNTHIRSGAFDPTMGQLIAFEDALGCELYRK